MKALVLHGASSEGRVRGGELGPVLGSYEMGSVESLEETKKGQGTTQGGHRSPVARVQSYHLQT